ncbi:hypothetical protein TRFO_34342 [Tritrichomonas foetus]|uniref:Uncharacterized protein n=1 Tax=Tritrichomonas foetus TaxID=1144522 RepID=A0A1J4JJ56_9EUKA|nr:hypothetical protein TRFO_34342 [Tritrichomonas foetus]|eukprot:OHS99208.1 hypothetical protein TRFO_34342 [Tritrichomonas foetus]
MVNLYVFEKMILGLPQRQTWIIRLSRKIRKFIFTNSAVCISLALFLQCHFFEYQSIFSLFFSCFCFSVFVWFTQYRQFDNLTVFSVAMITNFLQIFGLNHPDFNYLNRVVLLFSMTDMSYSLLHQMKNQFFIVLAFFLYFLVKSTFSLSAYFCIFGFAFISFFESLAFHYSFFHSQKRIRMDLSSLSLSLFLQIATKNKISFHSFLLGVVLVLVSILQKYVTYDFLINLFIKPKIETSKLILSLCSITFVFLGFEFYISKKIQSIGFRSLTVRTFFVNLIMLSSGIDSSKRSNNSLRFSFGWVRFSNVLFFSFVIFQILSTFYLFAKVVEHLISSPFILETGLPTISIFFLIVETFLIFQMALINSKNKCFNTLNALDIIFQYLTAALNVLSAICIESLDIYFLDSLTCFLVSLSMIKTAISLLSPSIFHNACNIKNNNILKNNIKNNNKSFVSHQCVQNNQSISSNPSIYHKVTGKTRRKNDFKVKQSQFDIHSLLVGTGSNDAELIVETLEKVGKVNDFHIWQASENLSVATCIIEGSPNMITEVIDELQKMKVRDLTIEANRDSYKGSKPSKV